MSQNRIINDIMRNLIGVNAGVITSPRQKRMTDSCSEEHGASDSVRDAIDDINMSNIMGFYDWNSSITSSHSKVPILK